MTRSASPNCSRPARTARHREYLSRELAQSRRWGADVREASPAQLAERLGYYKAAGDDFALWCPEDVYIEEPASLIRILLRRLNPLQNMQNPNANLPLLNRLLDLRYSSGYVVRAEDATRLHNMRELLLRLHIWHGDLIIETQL